MQAEPVQQSFASWLLHSLGPFYAIVLPLLGLLLFAGGVIAVLTSRRPGVIAACLAFVPVPLLIGLFAMFQGMVQSFSVIAASTTAPTASDLAAGASMALVAPLAALVVTIPGLLVLAFGLLFRTVTEPKTS